MRAAVTRLLPTLALALALVTSLPGLAAEAAEGPFRDLSPASFAALAPRGVAEAPLPRSFRALAVDLGELEDLLALAPAEGSSAALTAPLLLALPYPDGSDRLFRVEESPLVEPELAARYPEIRTFTVQGADDPTASGRLSFTPLGFHAMVLATEGTIYIDPYRRGEGEVALSFFKSEARRAPGAPFVCEVREDGGQEGAAEARACPRRHRPSSPPAVPCAPIAWRWRRPASTRRRSARRTRRRSPAR